MSFEKARSVSIEKILPKNSLLLSKRSNTYLIARAISTNLRKINNLVDIGSHTTKPEE